jgi:glycine/D-amino acid oxidase-like deaminating enzyme
VVSQKKQKLAITTDGYKITAGTLIIACGYETGGFLKKSLSRLSSTYAIISEPVHQDALWFRSCIIWETARPYLYIRTTSDNRIIVGGKDEPFYNPEKRDALLVQKSASLARAFRKIFPAIPFKTDFRWTGTFAETPDSLPYIDSYRGKLFVMGFGGNGITFSQLAGKLLVYYLKDINNPDMKLFSFRR